MSHTVKVDSKTFLKMFNREEDFNLDDYDNLKDVYKDNDILIIEEEKTGRFFTTHLERIEVQYPGFADFVTDSSISIFHLTKISNITF